MKFSGDLKKTFSKESFWKNSEEIRRRPKKKRLVKTFLKKVFENTYQNLKKFAEDLQKLNKRDKH